MKTKTFALGLVALALAKPPLDAQTNRILASPEATILKDTVIKDGFGSVIFLRFSPNGQELARVCMFGPVMLLDTASYKKARTFPLEMRMVAYSPDGTRIATAEGTDGARIWDAAPQGKRMPKETEVLVEQLYQLENPVHVLEPPSRDRGQRVFLAEFSPDGKRLITTHGNGHVKVWNTSSWVVEDDITVTDGEVRAVAFAPDSRTVVIGAKGVLHHWSFENKAEIRTHPTNPSLGAITGIVFAPDSKTLVTAHQSGSNSSVMIWNITNWVARSEGDFACAEFSKDGKVLALGGRDVKLIDSASGKQIRTIELPEMTLREGAPRLFQNQPYADTKIPIAVHALAFSPDGSTLAAGTADGTVRLLKMRRYNER
jgi:WD40 repeat protein